MFNLYNTGAEENDIRVSPKVKIYGFSFISFYYFGIIYFQNILKCYNQLCKHLDLDPRAAV